jgi:hypothetical protein
MSTDIDEVRRVRFFGVHDLAAGMYVSRVVALAAQFNPSLPIVAEFPY